LPISGLALWEKDRVVEADGFTASYPAHELQQVVVLLRQSQPKQI
jgi:hypothetical protein